MLTSMKLFEKTFGSVTLALRDSLGKISRNRNKFIGACIGVKTFF